MTLCVQSRHSLDELEEMVTKIFSAVSHDGHISQYFMHYVFIYIQVPSNDTLRPNYKSFGLPFDNEKFCRLHKVIPVNDCSMLDIYWAMAPLLDEYQSRPMHYISHLIGHEGEGSILSYLKKK